jgi:hypothetical protein
MSAAASLAETETLDLNDLAESRGIASARAGLDHFTLLDSCLLTHDEADLLRPRYYRALVEVDGDPSDVDVEGGVRLYKVHDAYTLNAEGEPLLGGRIAADGAIIIVRDPRDVAPSLANHLNVSVDQAIASMNNPDYNFCDSPNRRFHQFRQKLFDWSRHIQSWLGQTDLPVHLVRYEDLHADPVKYFSAAMSFAGREVSAESVARAVQLTAFQSLQTREAEAGFRESPTNRKFFRCGRAGGWRTELTAAQIEAIEAKHLPMMQHLGYASAQDEGSDL